MARTNVVPIQISAAEKPSQRVLSASIMSGQDRYPVHMIVSTRWSDSRVIHTCLADAVTPARTQPCRSLSMRLGGPFWKLSRRPDIGGYGTRKE